jgi:HK97 family phage major capsid protein
MAIKELKALIDTATANYEAQKKENEALQTKFKSLDEKHTDLMGKFDKLKEGGDADGAAKMAKTIDELQEEISDLRSKYKNPVVAISDEKQKDALKTIAKKAVGAFLKTKDKQGDFFEFVAANAVEQCKTLNISSPETGGLAVAETLARDVMDYYRDVSPIIGEVGRKSAMTRSYRQMIRVSWPSVAEGIENVAGVVPAETTTQEYVEVKSKEFKMYASPRITNEALSGVDIDIYSDLVMSLGEEQGVYLANQILYGDGQDKNARGILSSTRFDITDLTGESWKPTLAPVLADARSPDFYPAYATGVLGAIGADDKAKVDWLLTFMRKLPKRYRSNAKLYMNENTLLEFELLRDANDRPIFRMNYMEGEPRLNGKPVVIDDTLPDIAVDSAFIMYGDLPMAYAINDGDIDQLLLDPYTKKGSLIVYTEKEMFEMAQRSDAILIGVATTNGLA